MALNFKLVDKAIRYLSRLTNRTALQNLSYAQDGLYTEHSAEFMKNDHFLAAYAAGEATGSWSGAPVHWRVYIACWLADQACRLDGDLIECGVNRGGIARAIVSYLDGNLEGKHFYLLDTYNGMPLDKLTDRELGHRDTFEQHYKDSLAAVLRTFDPFPSVIVVQGLVPESFQKVRSEMFSFIHIDMNNARSEIAAADYLWPKLTAGGFMLLDDYGWQINFDQRTAFDKFARDRGLTVLSLPTGQGLLIKG